MKEGDFLGEMGKFTPDSLPLTDRQRELLTPVKRLRGLRTFHREYFPFDRMSETDSELVRRIYDREVHVIDKKTGLLAHTHRPAERSRDPWHYETQVYLYGLPEIRYWNGESEELQTDEKMGEGCLAIPVEIYTIASDGVIAPDVEKETSVRFPNGDSMGYSYSKEKLDQKPQLIKEVQEIARKGRETAGVPKLEEEGRQRWSENPEGLALYRKLF